jgi:hypothetical protein
MRYLIGNLFYLQKQMDIARTLSLSAQMICRNPYSPVFLLRARAACPLYCLLCACFVVAAAVAAVVALALVVVFVDADAVAVAL